MLMVSVHGEFNEYILAENREFYLLLGSKSSTVFKQEGDTAGVYYAFTFSCASFIA